MSIVEHNIKVHWDDKEGEYYTLVPIDKQTLKIAINVYEWTDTTIYGNIYISLYTKRKHKQHNEDNAIMTGLNPLKTVILGIRAFEKVEDALLQGYNDRFKVIISCSWVSKNRRDAYYAFLSKRGYRYDKLFNEKVIMKVWKKGEYEPEDKYD